jgi:hypothetical protein
MIYFLRKYSLYIFYFLFYAYCLNIYFISENNTTLDFTPYLKLILVPTLLLYIFINANKRVNTKFRKIIFLILFFTWVSDVFFLFQNPIFFTFSLVSLTASFLYFSKFLRNFVPIKKEGKGTSYMIITTLIILAILFFFFKLVKEELFQKPIYVQVAIFTYTLSLGFCSVLISNIVASGRKKMLGIRYFFPSTLLFVLYFFLLLFLDFKNIDFHFLKIILALTYGYGQALLAQGFSKYLGNG